MDRVASPSFYVIAVTPSYYDIINSKGLDYYPVSMVDHLPEKPETFKDLEGNISTLLSSVQVGDSLVFHSDKHTTDIEKKIERIEVNTKTFTKLIYFKKDSTPY